MYAPPSKALRAFSWFLGARQPPGMSDCFEMRCHSDPFAVILGEAKDLALRPQGKLREESRPGLLGAVCPTQSKIPRFALRKDDAYVLYIQ